MKMTKGKFDASFCGSMVHVHGDNYIWKISNWCEKFFRGFLLCGKSIFTAPLPFAGVGSIIIAAK